MKITFLSLILLLLAVPYSQAQTKAAFTASPSSGCSPASIKFINQSTGTGLTYFWDLGNGNTSTLTEPKAIYYSPGHYTVKLIVTDSKGKRDSITKVKFIEVFKNPKANFEAAEVKGCTPFDPNLMDKSTRGSGMINSWTWDYGNGKVVNNQIPIYAYTSEGKFSVSLMVKDANGCKSDTLFSNYISVYNSVQPLFVADKTQSCDVPFTVNFTNKSLGLKSGDTFEWDFGDGTTSNSLNPTKVYTDTGKFSVSLTVKSLNGCIKKERIPNYIIISKLKPNFKYDPTTICENGEVNFSNATLPSSFNVNCNWDFGDGKSAAGGKVKHNYVNPGKYTVTLTVKMANGSCTETLIVKDAITVLAKPKTEFYISDTLFCKPGYMDTLIDQTKNVVSRSWYIGDTGYISSNKGVIFKIGKPGYTNVMLVTFNGACYDTLTKQIYKDSIVAKFEADPNKGCKPLKVTFNDLSSSVIPITSILWDLGNGDFNNQPSFDYKFLNTGKFTIRLTVTSEKECVSTYVDTVYVGDKPDIEFKLPYTEKCNGTLLEISTAKNKNKFKVDEWTWYLDDKKLSESKNLNYRLKESPDVYDIKLIAGYHGCYDTFVVKDSLKVLPPLVSYKIEFDSCKGFPYTFVNTSIMADEIGWIFDDTVILNKDTLIVRKNDPWPQSLYGKNFSSGCKDTYKELDPTLEEHLISLNYSGSLCAPAVLTFSNNSINYGNYIWDWGDGKSDKNANQIIKKVFEKPGKYNIKLKGSTLDGCNDSVKTYFEVKGPEVFASISPLSGCGPMQLTLINKTKNLSSNNKFWKISGLPSIKVTADTMYYTLSKPGPLSGGRYAVSLNIEDNSGCLGIYTDTIKVNGIGYDFSISSLATCGYPRLTINPIFNDSNVDIKNLTYFWDIGDGRKFQTSYVDFLYKNAGNYRLTLKIVDKNGCITEQDTQINIKGKTLEANFTADNLDANCPPLHVNFVSKSKDNFGKITSYFWDFGDGSTSTIQNPSHVYLVAGKFSVKHAVLDNIGCTDTINYKDLILIDGPIGKYSFDKKIGCTPLNVNFTSTVTNTFKMEWDMGDGKIIEDSTSAKYTYTRTGQYIPLLVLADSFGCKYTLPPIDTLRVFPYPIAKFNYNTPCINQPVHFINSTHPSQGTIKKCIWDFGDGDTSTQLEPIHTFNKEGSYKVTLRVWNSADCDAVLVKDVVVKNIKADFKLAKDFYCAGQKPELVLDAKSDTTIKKVAWFVNDIFVSNQINPILPATGSGVYKIKLAVEDHLGCKDTLKADQGMIIGDTLIPANPVIYRTSVESDYSVVLDFSSYRSFDFKNYTVYFGDKKALTIANKNDTSVIIDKLNTLHKVYCFKVTATNICLLESELNKSIEHCTVENKAKGELKQVNVSWNAYKGWPVKTYDIYRENISLKGDYHYLATVPGTQLHYIDTAVFCKMTHFYKIKANELNGNQMVSWSDTSAAKPLFDKSVPPNDIIRATVDFDQEITIEWAGSGTPRIPIVEYVLEKSEDGIHYKWYQSFKPDEFSFTDKKVKVDDQSYFYRTYAIDTCALLSPFTNFAKTILLHADTTPQERPILTWSSYQGWLSGVSEYEVQRKKEDGTFITIGYVTGNDSMLVDNVTDLNGYPYYCYRVIGYKNSINGKKQIYSISNEDCAPVRSRIYAPNAFTINGDNLNETFDIKGLYIRDYNIKIFNRWGEMVFESDNMNTDWDGYYMGKLCQMDAYIWIIKAVGVDDVKWPMSGTVTIIR